MAPIYEQALELGLTSVFPIFEVTADQLAQPATRAIHQSMAKPPSREHLHGENPRLNLQLTLNEHLVSRKVKCHHT